ncbi:MAG TPA: peptidylprolyl isomerase [Thermodesulfovibrionia bacterium]|nr:peptidylprolyl isomerase [Thermodesulfovibrionia bacterium]
MKFDTKKLLLFFQRTLAKFLILLLLLFLDVSKGNAVFLDRIVAVVNDEVITWSELVKEMQIEQSSGSKSEREVLDGLVNKKLQLIEAKKLGIKATKSEIQSTIQDIKTKYNINDEQLNESLTTQGLSMDDYKTELREQILLTKVVTYEVKGKIIITDQQMRQYYKAHYEQEGGDEKIKLRQIFLNAPQDESAKKVMEGQAEAVYNRLQGGEDFNAVVSGLPDSWTNSDLGYVTKTDLVPEVADVAFSLSAGQVSRPFWSTRGLHILKVDDRKGEGHYEKVQEEIKDRLYVDIFRNEYSRWLSDLRKKAFIEIKLEK